jgi:cyclic pyranopterin phosphate synthase
MVDVSGKEVTQRVAVAEARVVLPANVARALRESGHRTKKGPVFDTAIIAGVMAAKRTHELIPFCHPLGLENCSVEIEAASGDVIVIRCRVSVRHKTGVEMEALTGASVAALTVYDMCKALSHDIRIEQIQLLEKTGGKRDFARDDPGTPQSPGGMAEASEGGSNDDTSARKTRQSARHTGARRPIAQKARKAGGA